MIFLSIATRHSTVPAMVAPMIRSRRLFIHSVCS